MTAAVMTGEADSAEGGETDLIAPTPETFDQLVRRHRTLSTAAEVFASWTGDVEFALGQLQRPDAHIGLFTAAEERLKNDVVGPGSAIAQRRGRSQLTLQRASIKARIVDRLVCIRDISSLLNRELAALEGEATSRPNVRGEAHATARALVICRDELAEIAQASIEQLSARKAILQTGQRDHQRRLLIATHAAARARTPGHTLRQGETDGAWQMGEQDDQFSLAAVLEPFIVLEQTLARTEAPFTRAAESNWRRPFWHR
jgi:hypothetical protein